MAGTRVNKQEVTKIRKLIKGPYYHLWPLNYYRIEASFIKE